MAKYIKLDECWKVMADYPDYAVSTWGRVMKTKTGYMLKQSKTGAGYLSVHLWQNEKRRRCSVHRLVALTFIPNPDNCRCVDHWDEDKTNNCVQNLRWSTHQQNLRNVATKKSKSSLPVGVFKNRNQFSVQITVDNKDICMGVYKTVEMAEFVRLQAEEQHFGRFQSQKHQSRLRDLRQQLGMSAETWKNVTVNDRYLVSDYGRFKNVQGRILRIDNGRVTLAAHRFPVARLVAEAFVSNPEGYKCVKHKDGNVLNNAKFNLEWVLKAT